MRWFFILLLTINMVFYISYQDSGISISSASLVVTDIKNSIALISESGLGAASSAQNLASLTDDGAVGAETKAVVASGQPGCLLLGPYRSRDDLRREAKLVDGAKLSVESYERSADFWVYLGPYSSFNAAAKVGAELRAKRIDNFIIRSGALQNAISLGVFTTNTRAEVHAKSLLKRSYDVAVKRVPKGGERYWMSFMGREGDESYQAAELAMKKNTDNNKSLGKKSCNLIASYQDLD